MLQLIFGIICIILILSLIMSLISIISKSPSGPHHSPPSPPSPPPPPVDKSWYTTLLKNLNTNSVYNSKSKFSDLSGIILIKPGDNIVSKLTPIKIQWEQLVIATPMAVNGGKSLQNAIYPYNTDTINTMKSGERQGFDKPYTIIFTPDITKALTIYNINDTQESTLLFLSYYCSIISLQTNDHQVQIIGDIGPNYTPSKGETCSGSASKENFSSETTSCTGNLGRKQCGPWSHFVQTGAYLKLNSADNVFFKSIENINIKKNISDSPGNSFNWNTSQMCPIRNVDFQDKSAKSKSLSVELGFGVGGWISDSSFNNIYSSAGGKWMAQQQEYCFKNINFNKMGNYRGAADAATLFTTQATTGGYPPPYPNGPNSAQPSDIAAAPAFGTSSNYIDKTLNPQSCWTRYIQDKALKWDSGAGKLSSGCGGQQNFVFINSNDNGKKLDSNKNFLGNGQQICSMDNGKTNYNINPQDYQGSLRNNGSNVILQENDAKSKKDLNSYIKPYITCSGILVRTKWLKNYTIIRNNTDLNKYTTLGTFKNNTIYLILPNVYILNKKLTIDKSNVTILGVGFPIIKVSNDPDSGINVTQNATECTLAGMIFDAPTILNKNLQESVIKINGANCEIYDITVRTFLACPAATTPDGPGPYSNTETACQSGSTLAEKAAGSSCGVPYPTTGCPNWNIATLKTVGAACFLLINAPDCYIENIWLWRGDHWNWGGFQRPELKILDNSNINPFGLIVSVKATECTVVNANIEHQTLNSVLWIGENGLALSVVGEVCYKQTNIKDIPFLPTIGRPPSMEKFGDSSWPACINWDYGTWSDYTTETFQNGKSDCTNPTTDCQVQCDTGWSNGPIRKSDGGQPGGLNLDGCKTACDANSNCTFYKFDGSDSQGSKLGWCGLYSGAVSPPVSSKWKCKPKLTGESWTGISGKTWPDCCSGTPGPGPTPPSPPGPPPPSPPGPTPPPSSGAYLKEISSDIFEQLYNNQWKSGAVVYYTILANSHINKGSGFYSLFNVNGPRYAIQLGKNHTNINISSCWIGGWAKYDDNVAPLPVWNDIILKADGSTAGGLPPPCKTCKPPTLGGVQLGNAYYMCNIQGLLNGKLNTNISREGVSVQEKIGIATNINKTSVNGTPNNNKIGL